MNTIQRNKEQTYKGLVFVGKAGFTNAENLQQSANSTRRGFPTQLIKKGLLLSREMLGGRKIYSLSKAGV